MSILKTLGRLCTNQRPTGQFSTMVCLLRTSLGASYSAVTGIRHKQKKSLSQQQKLKPHSKQKYLKRPDWLTKMHQSLLRNADLPVPASDGVFITSSHLQSCSTDTLLSMAWNVSCVNDSAKSLMMELWRRMDRLDMEQILSIADILFINHVQADWYLGSMRAYFLENFDILDLTPSQLTRLVFHTLDQRNSIPPTFFLALEEVIARSMDSLSINQVAVICRSFFTSQTRFHSVDLLDKISVKLLKEFNSLSDHYLPLFMKIMRYSNFVKISWYKELGNILVEKNYLKKFRTVGQIMHITHGYASVRVSHPDLFSYVLTNSCHPRYKFRLKDLAKLVWSCGTMVANRPQDISAIEKIIKYLEYNLSVETALDYPANLVDLVNGLCFLNIYSDFLLNILFDSRNVSAIIELSKKNENKLPQLSIIDGSVDIEHPSYEGNRFDEASRQEIASCLGDFSMESEIGLKNGMREALTSLQEALGEDKVLFTRLLPHLWTADICLVWDTVQMRFTSHEEETGASCNQGSSRCVRLAIQVMSHMQTSYDGLPLGMLHMKLRQLKALGYLPVLVEADDAHRFVHADVGTTQDFLLETISEALGVSPTQLLS